MTNKEAMQMALDALEECLGWTHSDLTEAAHETLRARLAEKEHRIPWVDVIDEELVCAHLGVAETTDDYATAKKKLNDLICWNIQVDRDLNPDRQVQQKEQEPVAKSPTHGMTLGERIKHVGGWETERGTIEFGSPMAVDALIKHVLRDTAPVAASDTSQERVAETEEKRHDPKPQAWMLITEQGVCGGIFRFRYDAEVGARELRERFSIVPLYYSELPRREWQRLTEEEIWNADEIMAANSECGASFETLRQLVHAISDKLKEKNT